MPSGERRKRVETLKWRFDVPATLAFRFERLHYDPKYQKAVFGKRSQILSQLLEKYILEEETKLLQRSQSQAA